VRKVLVLTSHHPSRRRPLQAMYGFYTYQALARYCELRFLCPWPWWTRVDAPGDLLRAPRERWGALDIEYPAWWSIPAAISLHGAGMAWSLARRVAALRREFPFEAILTAWAYPDAVAAARIAARERVPLVATVLGSDVNDLPSRRPLAPQIRAGLSQARRVVAVSEALGAAVAALGVPRERIVVQHNGVDGEVFTPGDRREARAALGLPLERRLVGYVGRLSAEKGPDVLVEAMAALAGRDPGVDLAFVGSGPLEPALRARIAAAGLGERIRLLGHRGHDELPAWLRAVDVLCLPSRREGCPNVVLEALASGRPVVASAVGGVPELLRRDNGLLVPPDRPEALAGALADALGRGWDPALLRASVPSLSWDAVGRRYHALVAEVIDEEAALPSAAGAQGWSR
jgi:glycosyltransferase involved in cell wall biosynthesis